MEQVNVPTRQRRLPNSIVRYKTHQFGEFAPSAIVGFLYKGELRFEPKYDQFDVTTQMEQSRLSLRNVKKNTSHVETINSKTYYKKQPKSEPYVVENVQEFFFTFDKYMNSPIGSVLDYYPSCPAKILFRSAKTIGTKRIVLGADKRPCGIRYTRKRPKYLFQECKHCKDTEKCADKTECYNKTHNGECEMCKGAKFILQQYI